MDTLVKIIKLLAAAGLMAGLISCGAPTKSAADVAHLFDGNVTTLQSKQDSLCRALETRDEVPTVKGFGVDLGGCVDAGLAALDYKKIESFHFRGLDDDGVSANDKVIHKSVRSQVWLNKSLLGFASAISNQMKKKADNPNKTGAVQLEDSAGGKGLQNVAKTEINVLEEPSIDVENFQFSTLINFKVTGIIEADHDIQIHGRLIDNAFAVTVKTTKDRDFKRSLLKNFAAVILIIPHAGDIYMDMFVDVNVNNPGLESLVKEQVNTFLSTGLKTVIDSMMAL